MSFNFIPHYFLLLSFLFFPVSLWLNYIFPFKVLICFVLLTLSMIVVLLVKVYKDRSVVTQLVRRAERAGFKAIVLTVDTPRLGRREADIKNR